MDSKQLYGKSKKRRNKKQPCCPFPLSLESCSSALSLADTSESEVSGTELKQGVLPAKTEEYTLVFSNSTKTNAFDSLNPNLSSSVDNCGGIIFDHQVVPEVTNSLPAQSSLHSQTIGPQDPPTHPVNENIRRFFSNFLIQNSASDLSARLDAIKAHLAVTSEDIEQSFCSDSLVVASENIEQSFFNNSVNSVYSKSHTENYIPNFTFVGNSHTSSCSASTQFIEASNSHSVDSLTHKMNSKVGDKSREQVEAERKARKAAKQAGKAKAKGTTEVDCSVQTPSTKADACQKKPSPIPTVYGGNGGQDQKSKQNKSPPKNCAEMVTDSVQKLHLNASSQQTKKSKARDVPDFVPMSIHGLRNEGKELFNSDYKCKEGQVAPVDLGDTIQEKVPNLELTQPPVNCDGGKSKSELRAERRAKQESQRATKALQQQQQQSTQTKQKQQTTAAQPSAKLLEQVKSSTTKPAKAKVSGPKMERGVKLFSHLYQNTYKSISHIVGVNHPQYHPAIVRLGVQYAKRTILGSNARCIALLYALREVISDYATPPEKEFSRGLEGYLHPNMEFLQQCRPQAVSMINAMRYIKWQLAQLSNTISDAEAKQKLHEAIEQYIFEQIGKAAEAIGKAVKDKISDNDVILVYACSSLVLSALKVALDEGRHFRVVVVDSLPWLEGREMLRRLVSLGVKCSYVHISAASFVMREVSKVLLGAHALLANGYVMSRAGSSQVALLAHTYNKPVLVCCETHKFSERVQTDSFVYNELGDPDELIGARRAGERETEQERPLANWRDLPHLNLLNLVYDVTPPDLVTAVVTERAILPCTSVPVILRIKPIEC